MNPQAKSAVDPPERKVSTAIDDPTPPIPPAFPNQWILGLGMTLTALAVGLAIHIKDGNYDPTALWILTFAIFVSIAAISLEKLAIFKFDLRMPIIALIISGVLLDVLLLINWLKDMNDPRITAGLLIMGSMTALCALRSRWVKHIAVTVMLATYLLTARHEIIQLQIDEQGPPGIDVYEFQQEASRELMKGKNPYAMRFRNLYQRDTRFYSPGVVDENNMLNYGFPYPPLSLFMSMPSVILLGDCRYSNLLALVMSAGLMAYVRPGRFGALAAGMLLLMPRSLYVLNLAWTEPLLLFNFSLVMFCACRWRAAMPYALGLFFATKQHSILVLPVVILLVEGPNSKRRLPAILLKAGLVAAAVTAPLFLWNPRQFWHDVVQWQFVQPFRMDALSYMVWLHKNNLMGWLFIASTGRPSLAIPIIFVLLAVLLCLWRSARTPAGFAGAVTVIYLVFFAFNKQAFCNYYFFVVAVACWSVAVLRDRAIHARSESSR